MLKLYLFRFLIIFNIGCLLHYLVIRWFNFWTQKIGYLVFLFSESLVLFIGSYNTYFIAWNYFSFPKEIHGVDGEDKKILSGENTNLPTPGVDIFICCYNEPLELIQESIQKCMEIDYSSFTIFVCDDGDNLILKNWVEKCNIDHYTSSTKIFYKKRLSIMGHAKAGNINDSLLFSEFSGNDLFLVLDCDMQPEKDIFKNMIPNFYQWDSQNGRYEKKEKLAFVQAPQRFYNIHRTDCLGQQYYYFYGIILRVWDYYHCTPCCGTNVIFTKNSIKEIGGFQYESITEDFLTSMVLHARGYESKYCPKVVAKGLSPFSLSDFFKQRFRWSFGSCQLMPVFRREWRNLDWKKRYIYISCFVNLHLNFLLFILITFPVLHLYYPNIFFQLSNLTLFTYLFDFGLFMLSFIIILLTIYSDVSSIYLIKNFQETVYMMYCNLLVLGYYYLGIPYGFQITPKDKRLTILTDLSWMMPFLLYIGFSLSGFYYYQYVIGKPLDQLNVLWIAMVYFQISPIVLFPFFT